MIMIKTYNNDTHNDYNDTNWTRININTHNYHEHDNNADDDNII